MVISNYIQAVCVRERQGMPTVGVCVDRRALRPLNAMLENVRSMICFCCAQVHTHVPLWERMYTPGQAGRHENEEGKAWSEHRHKDASANSIEMMSVGDSLRRFKKRDEQRFLLHFGLRRFKERYASELTHGGNPFVNSKQLDEDAPDWIQNLKLREEAASIPLLCCPEGVQKCRRCKGSRMQICEDCNVPLCFQCRECIVHGRRKDIPMALCNDNFWGYASEIIYKYQVRWLEAALVQPVWTTMLVCYVEGDKGLLMNE